MMMKNNIQQTVQTKFGTKQVTRESARKWLDDLQICFSQNTMQRFFGVIFVRYDLYKITETDWNLLYIQTV